MKISNILPCGCIPDASGYGYCSTCTRKLRENIWRNMSEKNREYDRIVAPDESKELDKSLASDYSDVDCCSCHINPPCSYCISKTEDDE